MTKSDRALLVGGGVGVATWLFGLIVTMALFPRDTMTTGGITFVIVVVTLGAIAIGVVTGAAWSRVEESAARVEEWASRPISARPAAWPEHPPTVRFRNERPGALVWGVGMASPRQVIARIEGQLLHRRLVLAAREFITRDAEFAPLDGLDLSDRGEPFQAVVRCLRGDQENALNRWLIIVRDPDKVGDEFSATTSGAPPVTQPSVLAAVVTFKKGTGNWRISVDELHALDAAYVAGCAVSAWQKVARERDLATAGTTATAKLDRDGITWDITLHVLTTEGDAEDTVDRLDDLLGELRAPVDVWAVGALPDIDDDAEEEERDASNADEGNSHDAAGDQQDDARDDK
jgi:hypothetical protein